MSSKLHLLVCFGGEPSLARSRIKDLCPGQHGVMDAMCYQSLWRSRYSCYIYVDLSCFRYGTWTHARDMISCMQGLEQASFHADNELMSECFLLLLLNEHLLKKTFREWVWQLVSRCRLDRWLLKTLHTGYYQGKPKPSTASTVLSSISCPNISCCSS